MEVPEGRRIVLSGQVGVDAEERTVGPGITEQTACALGNFEKILAEVSGDLSQVIMLRLYIVESARDQQEPIAEALRQRYAHNQPPPSWIVVSGLSLPQWLIEIEAEAVVQGHEPIGRNAPLPHALRHSQHGAASQQAQAHLLFPRR